MNKDCWTGLHLLPSWLESSLGHILLIWCPSCTGTSMTPMQESGTPCLISGGLWCLSPRRLLTSTLAPFYRSCSKSAPIAYLILHSPFLTLACSLSATAILQTDVWGLPTCAHFKDLNTMQRDATQCNAISADFLLLSNCQMLGCGMHFVSSDRMFTCTGHVQCRYS